MAGNPFLSPAPAAGVTPPSPPVPGSIAAAREAGAKIGKAYGEFLEWAESFLDLLQHKFSGVSVWDRMTITQQQDAIAKVQRAYETLPKLPPATTVEMATALRQGFVDSTKKGYEAARFMTRAVWIAAEFAKIIVLHKAMSPPVFTVAGFGEFEDCAAHTASRAILEMSGVEVPASYIVRTFGLPRASISTYEDAVSFALNYFEKLGITLAAKPGGFIEVARGGRIGSYVIFLKGGRSGGHVVFGQVTASGLKVIDNQRGSIWNSIEAAQRELGMQATQVRRIEAVALPQ